MHHIIADSKIAKVGDESSGLRFRLTHDRLGRNVRIVVQVIRADDNDARPGDTDAGRECRAQNNRGAKVPGKVAGLVENVFAACMLSAAAEPIGQPVLAQKIRHALDFALVGRCNQYALVLCGERFYVLNKLRNRSVKTHGRARGKRNLIERHGVFFEYVDCA